MSFTIVKLGNKTFKYDKILTRKFEKKIASLRKNANLTQDELAFTAGISASYLSAIERGITDTTISTAKRLAKALETRLNELFIFD